MASPGKLPRRQPAATSEWNGPGAQDGEALRGLPSTPSAQGSGSSARGAWRRARWVAAPILLLGIVAPVAQWLHYRSQHVISKNAAVRGYLAEVGSRLTGSVVDVRVDVGDQVKEGQLLVRLENRHLQAEVAGARAEIEGLERTIEVERLAITHERRRINQQQREAQARVAAADAQSEAARIRADAARRSQEMRESLFSQEGIVSVQDVRDAESDRQTAEALLDEARANSAAAKSAGQSVWLSGDAIAIQEGRIGVLEADLSRARARLARAEADLAGAAILAPADGAIVRRIVQPGSSIEAGQPVLSMRLGRTMWVEAWIDEDELASVHLGSVATVTLESMRGREFTGVVDTIGLATDLEIPASEIPQPRASRMRAAPVVGVRIRLGDPPPELLPGLSAVVAIRRSEAGP